MRSKTSRKRGRLILFLCNDGVDLQIVKLKSAGQKNREVADLMGIPTRQVTEKNFQNS